MKLGDYVKFRVKSVNAHGLHSPFMYKLATQCYYDKNKYPDYQQLKAYHNELLKRDEIVVINDLGAGSKKFKSHKRKLKDIAKISGSSLRDMKLYYRLSKYFQPQQILELGTSLGKATYAMALGNPSATIITVEGDKKITEITQKIFNFKQITAQVVNQDFDDFLNELNQSDMKFDMILMDGNHRLEPTLRYFEKLQKHLHNNSVVIVDDIYWSKEMKQAWQKLTQHPAVRQSVDSYYFGLLFFRKEQFKQNFMIRI